MQKQSNVTNKRSVSNISNIIKSWAILGDLGWYWMIFGDFWQSWLILVILVDLGQSWSILVDLGDLWRSWAILSNHRWSWAIFDYLWRFRVILSTHWLSGMLVFVKYSMYLKVFALTFFQSVTIWRITCRKFYISWYRIQIELTMRIFNQSINKN